jgi:hypothetical protein
MATPYLLTLTRKKHACLNAWVDQERLTHTLVCLNLKWEMIIIHLFHLRVEAVAVAVATILVADMVLMLVGLVITIAYLNITALLMLILMLQTLAVILHTVLTLMIMV